MKKQHNPDGWARERSVGVSVIPPPPPDWKAPPRCINRLVAFYSRKTWISPIFLEADNLDSLL